MRRRGSIAFFLGRLRWVARTGEEKPLIESATHTPHIYNGHHHWKEHGPPTEPNQMQEEQEPRQSYQNSGTQELSELEIVDESSGDLTSCYLEPVLPVWSSGLTTNGPGIFCQDSLRNEKSRFHTSTWRYERLLVVRYYKKCSDIPISTYACNALPEVELNPARRCPVTLPC